MLILNLYNLVIIIIIVIIKTLFQEATHLRTQSSMRASNN